MHRPAWWTFRIWHGMRAGVWFRLLRRHRFAVSPRRLPRALAVTLVSLIVSYAAWLQRTLYGGAIGAEPVPTPVFIVGHWRSGTSFLHELIATDARFIAPTTFECFCADHFMRLTRIVTRFGFLMPKRRPMDEMTMGWSNPQEDEFALMAMGVASPYEMIGFPGDRRRGWASLDPEDLGPGEARAWQAALLRFFRSVALQRRRAREKQGGPAPRWLLSKSPTHTARIALLARAFPGAKFIHVVRDPRQLVPSSRRLWPALFLTQSFETALPDPREVAADVDEFARRLYRDFDADLAGLPPASFAEVRYEDLARDPHGTIARLAGELGLDLSDDIAERVGAYLAERRDYRPNRYRLSPLEASAIDAEWSWYARRFGYAGAAGGSADARPELERRLP